MEMAFRRQSLKHMCVWWWGGGSAAENMFDSYAHFKSVLKQQNYRHYFLQPDYMTESSSCTVYLHMCVYMCIGGGGGSV